jgi:sugar lactone lactonase YvrE
MGPMIAIEGTDDVQGESPVWSEREQALYWVDTRGYMVRRLDYASGKITSWKMPELPCSLVIREKGGLVVAMETCIVMLDTASGEIVEKIAAPHTSGSGMRFADGRCDRRGRFWVGAKHDATSGPVGILYRFDPDRRFTPTENGIGHPNSLAWSPDNKTMYFADSADLAIRAYPFDIDSGTIGARRHFAKCVDHPDGAAMDRDGCLWSAQYWGSTVARYRPDGTLEREIQMPCSLITACTFGGPNMDRLYITTARQLKHITAEELAKQPLAGRLFYVDVGVQGLPEARFAG